MFDTAFWRDRHKHNSVCMHWFPWKHRCDSSSWLGVPLCSLALTKKNDQNSVALWSFTPSLERFKPITASVSLIGGTLWRCPPGWEGLLVGRSPCLVCSRSALDLTNNKRVNMLHQTRIFHIFILICERGNVSLQVTSQPHWTNHGPVRK